MAETFRSLIESAVRRDIEARLRELALPAFAVTAGIELVGMIDAPPSVRLTVAVLSYPPKGKDTDKEFDPFADDNMPEWIVRESFDADTVFDLPDTGVIRSCVLARLPAPHACEV